jgi:uncharacterized membrane protein YecN with MAPEG domain
MSGHGGWLDGASQRFFGVFVGKEDLPSPEVLRAMFAVHVPTVTIWAAGLLGLIFVVLSARVVMARMQGKVLLGDGDASTAEGGPAPLLVAIRSQANFAEYVPLCLLLISGLEMRSGPTLLVKTLAGFLILARIAHPYGMAMPSPNPFRAGGFLLTVLVLAVASLAAILDALTSPV